jgi:6-phosphogluconolactonase
MNIIETSNFTLESAEFISKKISTTLNSSDYCVIALAGGKTPIPVYAELAKMSISWEKIYFIFGDERIVPSTDPESNYKTAHDSLLNNIPISADHILRIETELGPQKAAESYEARLVELQTKLKRDYLIDVTLLGIGGDGHTASLFPGTAALGELERLVVANTVPQLKTERITLTFKALNDSREIIFLVHDPAKKEILEKIWAGEDFPAANIKPSNGNVTWVVGK